MEIIQIVSLGSSIGALSTDGQVFIFNQDNQRWKILPPLPLMVSKKMVSKDMAVIDLGLSHRVVNALHRKEIFTVGELIGLNSAQITELSGIGKKSFFEMNVLLEEIKKTLTDKA